MCTPSRLASYSEAMSRGPQDKFEHDQLGPALAWLRARQRLTQRDVAERASTQTSCSPAYYADLERGRRAPSTRMLGAVLSALASDEAELSGILTTQPWQRTPQGSASWRPSTGTPDMAAYYAAPDDGAALAAMTAPVAARGLAAAPAPAFATASAGVTGDDHAARVRGEVAELGEIYRQLGPADQRTLIGLARQLDRRRTGR